MAEPLFPHSGKDLRSKYHIFLDYMHSIACAGNVDVHSICCTGIVKKTTVHKAQECHQCAPT